MCIKGRLFLPTIFSCCILIVMILVYLLWQREPLSQRLDRANSQWQAQGITDYRIGMQIDSGWHTVSVEITVRQNSVVESKCEEFSNKGCERFDPNLYTVPGLFSLLQYNPINNTKTIPVECLNVDFDEIYSFPSDISRDCSDMFDEELKIQITKFSVLE